jgi:GxxExxY protein
LEFQGIPFLSKPPQTLQHRGGTLAQTFNPDFICYDKIILEIKAVSELIDEHRAQVLNYLAATGLQARSARELWPLSENGIRAFVARGTRTRRS